VTEWARGWSLCGLACAVVSFACGGGSEESGEPVAVDSPCEGPELTFAPRGTYRVEVRERGQVYRSEITFEPFDGGWSAIEGELHVEPATDALGTLAGAELRWTLDQDGVPLEPPTESGSAHPGVLQNLTVFAFRPSGLTMSPVCEGAAATRRWVDGMERTRTVAFEVQEVDDEAVTFAVRSTVTTAVNEWASEGRLRVKRADGFTGEAEVEVTGPGGRRHEREVTIARAP